MWNEQKRFLDSQLSSGESLLWSGQPRQGIFFRAFDLYLIPFSLLWCGFAIFWETGVLSTDAPFFMKLWGIPFVLVGLYMVVGRFFVDAKQRAKMYYGVTNDRAIIVSGIFSKQVKSLNLKTLTDISLTEKTDGSGTISFGLNDSNWQSFPFSKRNQPEVPSFDSIQNAKKVYEIIRNAQKSTN
jgi:Bacterial PH domain